MEKHKNDKYTVMYWGAILTTGLLHMFLTDLALCGRFGKYEEIWWRVCNQDIICMTNYDLLAIYVLLMALMFLWYKLVPIYKKCVFLIPILGIIAHIGWTYVLSIFYT